MPSLVVRNVQAQCDASAPTTAAAGQIACRDTCVDTHCLRHKLMASSLTSTLISLAPKHKARVVGNSAYVYLLLVQSLYHTSFMQVWRRCSNSRQIHLSLHKAGHFRAQGVSACKFGLHTSGAVPVRRSLCSHCRSVCSNSHPDK